MLYSYLKKRSIRPATFLISFSSAAPNTVPQLKRCSMGQNFFQGRPKIAAFFTIRACWAISVSKIFDWGVGHKSRAMTLPEISERRTFCGTKLL